MKTKYCYIPDVENFSDETRIYGVYVGDSNREIAQCRYVDSYASKNGAFWRPWDADTDYFLKSKGYSFFTASYADSKAIRRLDMDIPKFVKHIQNGDLDMIKVPAHIVRNHMHQLAMFSSIFYLNNQARQAGKTCYSVTSKNLSHDKMGELLKVAGQFCLILMLFLFAAYLDGIEGFVLGY